nr:MAG TPA: hypothetical protein [Caudoviricetes sp.]
MYFSIVIRVFLLVASIVISLVDFSLFNDVLTCCTDKPVSSAKCSLDVIF